MSRTASEWGHTMELWVAARWWLAPLMGAVDKAYPADTLFVSLADQLRKASNKESFVERLVDAIVADFIKRDVPWNPEEPMSGYRLRRVGIEGAIRSEPLKDALTATGYEEVLPFIPDGCVTTICPGKVFGSLSRRDRETVMEVKDSIKV